MLRILLLVIPLCACISKKAMGKDVQPFPKADIGTLISDTSEWHDSDRQRTVPVLIQHISRGDNSKQPIVLFSHGYGKNEGDSYLKYSYLIDFFVQRGYFVVSIQHELKTDPLMPLGGNIAQNRGAFWERGVENISFVLEKLASYEPLDFSDVTLIGHSNGGDISTLFATRFPEKIKRLITLDHLRVSLPEYDAPKIASIRASDTTADPGVLPDESSCREHGIRIVSLKGVKHGDMDDKGTAEQKKNIIEELSHIIE